MSDERQIEVVARAICGIACGSEGRWQEYWEVAQAAIDAIAAWNRRSTPGPIDSSSAYSSPIGADPAIEVGAAFNRRLDAVRVEDYERAIREFANDETPDALWCIERAKAIARQRGEGASRG